jgi:methionyl aminopeptidase
MIFLKTEDEIELLRASNLLVGKTLAEIAKVIKPGVTTKELDRVAEEFIRDNGAVPTFKGFPNQYGDPFPASICTSVNEQVVHGIPSDNVVLKEGDVVSVDCGTYMNGFCGDSAYTFCVGEVDEEVRKLLKLHHPLSVLHYHSEYHVPPARLQKYKSKPETDRHIGSEIP